MSLSPPSVLDTPVPIPAVEGVKHHWAEVDGLQIHYAEAGEGKPLILLHGWPQHWWCWREVIGPLANDHRVICPDIRGMGWSQGSKTGYSWHGLARDLTRLLDHLDIDEFTLVGHDWGLVIGYRACFNWPDRIRQFVALGGVHLWSVDGASLRLWIAPWNVYAVALLGDIALERFRLGERSLRVWRHAGQFTPEEIETYMSVMHQSRCRTASKQFDRNIVFHEIPHYLVHHRHIRSRVPTLHLNGDHDPLGAGTPDSYRKYADDMRLELVPGCGHFIAEERPDWLLERLERFLG